MKKGEVLEECPGAKKSTGRTAWFEVNIACQNPSPAIELRKRKVRSSNDNFSEV